jgi:lipopolysaccharide export system protein LptC
MNRVISARTDPQTARSYWTMNRSDSARAFQAARRHSRMVHLLRVALPLAIVFALAVIVLMAYFNPLRSLTGLPASVGNMVVHGSKITMEQPKLSGFTRDARAYKLTADSAAQDLTKPDMIELSQIHAQVEMKDKSTVHLSALAGTYDSKHEMLTLNRDIRLDSTNGYTGFLSEATVDVKKGDVLSEQPVRLNMLQGTLEANRLQIIESGDLVLFDRGVNMTVMLNKNDTASAIKPETAKPAAKSGTQ